MPPAIGFDGSRGGPGTRTAGTTGRSDAEMPTHSAEQAVRCDEGTHVAGLRPTCPVCTPILSGELMDNVGRAAAALRFDAVTQA